MLLLLLKILFWQQRELEYKSCHIEYKANEGYSIQFFSIK